MGNGDEIILYFPGSYLYIFLGRLPPIELRPRRAQKPKVLQNGMPCKRQKHSNSNQNKQVHANTKWNTSHSHTNIEQGIPYATLPRNEFVGPLAVSAIHGRRVTLRVSESSGSLDHKKQGPPQRL